MSKPHDNSAVFEAMRHSKDAASDSHPSAPTSTVSDGGSMKVLGQTEGVQFSFGSVLESHHSIENLFGPINKQPAFGDLGDTMKNAMNHMVTPGAEAGATPGLSQLTTTELQGGLKAPTVKSNSNMPDEHGFASRGAGG